jgi:hypothetical protein
MKLKGTNEEVARAWLKGEPMTSSNGSYRTDGEKLWSYKLMIGKRDKEGQPILLNVRGLISPTTSQHVNDALYVRENGDLIQPQAKLVKPAAADHLALYTKYSFPENPEVFEEWMQNSKIIRYVPTRVRPNFEIGFTEINDAEYFKALKLPKKTISAFIDTHMDVDTYAERKALHFYNDFWISDDTWNYRPAKREERVHLREFTYDPDTDIEDRQIFAYFLTQAGDPRSYKVETYIYKFVDTDRGLRLSYLYDDYLYPGTIGSVSTYNFVNPVSIYRGGTDPREFPILLEDLADALRAPFRIVEKDTESYRQYREWLYKEKHNG